MFQIQSPSVVIIATALGVGACGGTITTEGRDIVPGTAVRRDGRTCGAAAVPDTLPGVNRLVDSAAVAHLAEVSAVSAELVYGLRFDPQGRLAGIKLMAPVEPTPLAAPYRDLLSRTARAQPPQEDVWGIRLRIRAGESPELAVERSEFCQAMPRRTAGPTRTGMEIMTAEDIQELRNARPCRLLIRVSPEGSPLTVEIVQSSGSDIFDQQMLENWQNRRFDPATLDDTPVAAEFTAVGRIQFR